MVEIELRPRRRARRVRRALRRRADLLVATGAAVAVLGTGLVTLTALTDDDPAPRRTTTGAGALPSLRLGADPVTDPVVGPDDVTDDARPETPSVAVALVPGRRGQVLAPVVAPAPDGDPGDAPSVPVAPEDTTGSPDPSPGPLTRVVDPLVASVTGPVPLLAPVRATVHQVTSCADAAATGPATGAGATCSVPVASR